MNKNTPITSNEKIEWHEVKKGDHIIVRTPGVDDSIEAKVVGVTRIDQALSNPNGVITVQLESVGEEKYNYTLNRMDIVGPFVHYRTEALAFFRVVDGRGKPDSSTLNPKYEKRWTIVEAFVGVMRYELGKSISKEGEDLIVVRRIEIEPEDAMVYVYNDDNQLAVMQRADNFTAVYGYAEVLLTPEEVAAKTEVKA